MSIQKATSSNGGTTEEVYEFAAIPNSGKVNVANHSYGDSEAKEHTYTVTVEDGEAISCTCPADTYYSGKDKHREAVEEHTNILHTADPDPLAPVERENDCVLCGGTGTTDYGETCWACVTPGSDA